MKQEMIRLALSDCEQELKYRLSEEEGLRLCRYLSDCKISDRVQRNYFFDTADAFLRGQRAALRVREDDSGEVRRTFKAKTIIVDGVARSEQREDVWSGKLADLLTPPHASLEQWCREIVPFSGALHLLGNFENRRQAHRRDGVVIEVDRSSFPGGVIIWEAEIEGPDVVSLRAVWEKLCREAGVAGAPSRETKYERFLAALGKARVI